MTEKISRKFYFGKDIRKGYFASVYNYRPRNENILERKGEIFAVLRLKANPTFDLVTAGGILLDYFHETYFEIQETSTLMALEKTVIASGKHLAKLIDNDEKVAETGVEIDLIATALVGNVAYFVKAGKGSLMILRGSELVDLTEALKDPSGESMVEVASMELEERDRLFMGTESASKYLKREKIINILEEFDVDNFPRSEKENFDHALMIIGYGLDVKSVPQEEIEPPLNIEIDERSEPEDEEILKSEGLEDEIEETGDEIDEIEKAQEEDKSYEQTLDGDIDEGGEESSDATQVRSQKTYMVFLRNAVGKIKSIPDELKQRKRVKLHQETVKVGKTKLPKKVLLGLFVGIILLSALGVGIKMAIENNEKKIQQEETKTSLDTLEAKVTELENLVTDIKLVDSAEKRTTGLQLVQEANAELKKVEGKTDVEDKVKDFKGRINNSENYLNRIIPVVSEDRLVDVASFFPDAQISDITATDTKIYLTDESQGKIYSMNLDGSSLQEEVTGLKNPTSITTDQKGKVIFLDESQDNRLAVYDTETKTTKRIAGTSTSKIGEIADIEYAEIAGGRIYLIDKTNKKVMYTEKSGDNYGLPASRFELAELATGKDIYIIDNKIYVLLDYKQGLYRFLNGQDDTPELTGLNVGEDLLSAKGMFIDGVNMYFSDQEGKRITVFEKGVTSAKFVGQYKTSEEIFKNIKDIVVNTKQQKLFVLDNSEVYGLDLKQLNEL